MNSHWQSGIEPGTDYFKVVVCFERRLDGGLRAWSDQVPGFVLSHSNIDLLLADVRPALEGLLSEQFGGPIVAAPLKDLKPALGSSGVVDVERESYPRKIEFVAHAA